MGGNAIGYQYEGRTKYVCIQI